MSIQLLSESFLLGGEYDKDSRKAPDNRSLSRRNILLCGTTLAATSAMGSAAPIRTAQAQAQPAPAPAGRKPNILMIMADDIGWFNVSIYNHGIMGYRTPNIDRIGKEGAMFTDWYAPRRCSSITLTNSPTGVSLYWCGSGSASTCNGHYCARVNADR
jgi:hypothetical protein